MESGRRATPRDSTPRGWYYAQDAALLVGVSARTIGQWASHGYLKATRDPGPPQVFSFQDVAEGLAVHELLVRGASGGEIRRTVANCRNEWGDWPLTNAPLGIAMTPKRARIILKTGEHRFDISQATGQQTILHVDELTALVALLRRGGWVVKDHANIKHVEVDPDKLSGQPSLVGRRLAVEDVAEMAANAGGLESLHKDYRLTKGEIKDAVEWWHLVSEAALAA